MINLVLVNRVSEYILTTKEFLSISVLLSSSDIDSKTNYFKLFSNNFILNFFQQNLEIFIVLDCSRIHKVDRPFLYICHPHKLEF